METISPFAGIDPAGFVHAPKAIASFVGQMTAGIFLPGRERRKEPRYSVATIVEAQQLDNDLRPAGEAYQVVTRDISAGGIGILDTRPVDAKYLAVQLTNYEGEQLRLMVEVLRCQRLGRIYDIGGRFVTRQPVEQEV